MLTYTPDDLRSVIRTSSMSEYHKSKLLKKIDWSRLPDWDGLPASMKWNLCRAKLSRGCWDWGGWEYRSDWSKGIHEGRTPLPMWDGKSQVKLWVIAEEGIGDEIMAASCFDELFMMNPDTAVECDPRLLDVYRRTWGDRFVPRCTDWSQRSGTIIPLLDLLPIFRRRPSDCPGRPYLKPDPERRAYWRGVLPHKTGVAWSSRHGCIHPRPMPSVSLQYGQKVPGWCFDPGIDPVADFADQIDLISALDRVISCPMSVVHVAGALGVRVDVVMPPVGNVGGISNALHWRYECDLPFYANATVHRNWKSLLPSLSTGTGDTGKTFLSPQGTCPAT